MPQVARTGRPQHAGLHEQRERWCERCLRFAGGAVAEYMGERAGIVPATAAGPPPDVAGRARCTCGLAADVEPRRYRRGGGRGAGDLARGRADDCAGLPDRVKSAARKLVRDLGQPSAGPCCAGCGWAPSEPEAPSFTLVTVEAIPIRPAGAGLAALVRRALEPLFSSQAAAELVSLQLDLPDEAPLATSLDAEKIAWALCALVGNALRYVRRGDGGMPGGHIRVRAAHGVAQRMINLTVQDDGPGIPAGVRPWLFEPDPKTGRAAGVGLRLVHDIVAAHGGGMVIKSSAEPSERGTTVTLWLPVRDSS